MAPTQPHGTHAHTRSHARTATHARTLQKMLPDRAIVKLMLRAFAQSAAPLMDWTDIYNANITFYNEYVFDQR